MFAKKQMHVKTTDIFIKQKQCLNIILKKKFVSIKIKVQLRINYNKITNLSIILMMSIEYVTKIPSYHKYFFVYLYQTIRIKC